MSAMGITEDTRGHRESQRQCQNQNQGKNQNRNQIWNQNQNRTPGAKGFRTSVSPCFSVFLCALSCSLWFNSPAGAVDISRNAGTATAQFLKLEMGARHAAMGGTYAAHGSDVFTLWGQPAALTWAPDAWQVGFQHTEWFQGVEQEYIGVSTGISDRSRAGLVVNTVGVDGLTRAQENAAGGLVSVGGEFDARDWAVSGHYGWMVNEDIGVGVAARWIRSTLDDVSADAFAADLGVRMRVRSVEGLTVGASVTNLGTGMKFLNTRDDLPWAVRAGAAMRLRGLNLLLATDIVKYADRDVDGGVGVEWRPVDLLRLRAGYRSAGRDVGQGLTAGFGVNLLGFELDYAYVPFGDLGDAHRVSAGYVFGGGVVGPVEAVNERVPGAGGIVSQARQASGSGAPSRRQPPSPLPARILKNPR